MLDTGSKALGDRFNLVNAVPPAVPLITFLLCWRSGAYMGAFSPELALPDFKSMGWVELLLLPLSILLFGVVLAPFQIAMVRLLEGYWGGSRLGIRLTAMGIELQRRRMVRVQAATQIREDNGRVPLENDLRAAAAAEKIRRDFPEIDLLLPTGLGNILRAAETTAGERYGLDSIESYPRLRQMLSERLDAGLAQLLTQLDAAAAFAISFVLCSLLTLPLFTLGVWATVPVAFLLLAWLAYRGARVVARHHGQLLHAAFDLHRFDLLDKLHYRLPRDPGAEESFNSALSAFWRGEHPVGDTPRMPGPYAHNEQERLTS